MILGWLRMRERGMAAVGRMQDAMFVVVVSFLTSFVSIVGILEARERAWSLVRRTRVEEEDVVVVSGEEGLTGV
jgi:membrane-associated PAP2 superfamily phosphatase